MYNFMRPDSGLFFLLICEQQSFQCWTTGVQYDESPSCKTSSANLITACFNRWGASVLQCSGYCELTMLEGALDIVNLGMCVLGKLKFESHKQGS